MNMSNPGGEHTKIYPSRLQRAARNANSCQCSHNRLKGEFQDRNPVLLLIHNDNNRYNQIIKLKHWFSLEKHLLVGTQDLCVQSNKTGSNNDIHPDGYAGLDWTQRSCVPTDK
jgi:hypothetical protein